MNISNFHTHTTFCDGKSEAEELILEAIEAGCSEIGFSGHSPTDFDTSYCMSEQGSMKYRNRIYALKEKYKKKISVFCGVEQDYYSCTRTDCYDYIIGSVHYVMKEGVYIPVDESAEKQKKYVNEIYGGDFYAFIADYYKTVGDVYEKTKCDIIGHFDLVTKFNEGEILFDTSDKRYQNAVNDALEKLLKTPALFEINTGAISRGYRKTPYPEDFIMKAIAKSGKLFVLSSDCHSKGSLLFMLDTQRDELEKKNYRYAKTFSEIKNM